MTANLQSLTGKGVRKRAQQLPQRTAFWVMLELVEHLSMTVSIVKICNTK